MTTLYIVIPSYNEENNIQQVVREWHAIVASISEDSRLLIIDDGSRDSTPELLHTLEKQFSQLRIIYKQNGGHSSAILCGYQEALSAEADFIFQTDADRQTDPAEFPLLWNHRNEDDACIGVRNNRKDGVDRKIVALLLRLILLVFFGYNIKDANCPFRLIRHPALSRALASIPKGSILVNVLLSVQLLAQKNSVKWLPISFYQRRYGRNSINLWRIFCLGSMAIVDFWKFRKAIQNR